MTTVNSVPQWMVEGLSDRITVGNDSTKAEVTALRRLGFTVTVTGNRGSLTLPPKGRGA